MKKKVRVYFSTFVEVEVESDDFSSEMEMIESVEDNIWDVVTEQEIMENLAKQDGESKVVEPYTCPILNEMKKEVDEFCDYFNI